MRRPSCNQIEPLLAAHVADELPADESAAIAVHLDVCDSCRELAQVWSGLPEVARHAELEELPSAVAQRLTSGGRPARSSLVGASHSRLVVGAALAVAAGIAIGVLGLWLALGDGPAPGAADRLATAAAEPRAAIGDQGRRLLDLGAGATIALDEGARARLVSRTGSAVRVRLERGRALIDFCPAASALELEVETPAGSIVARSAVFSLEVAAADMVRVVVEEGYVEILDQGGDVPTLTFAAGDEHLLGRGAATASAEPFASETAVVGTPSEPSIDALLRQARAHRRDRDFGLASRAYQRLIRAHPGSAAARNTLVALAQMELSSMDRPAAALDHFEAYLAQAPSGVLAEEARAGRARAHDRLGRSRALLRSTGDYLVQHPAGRAAAEMLRRRGDAQRRLGNCGAAAHDYRRVRRGWPGSSEAGHAAKGLDACGSGL